MCWASASIEVISFFAFILFMWQITLIGFSNFKRVLHSWAKLCLVLMYCDRFHRLIDTKLNIFAFDLFLGQHRRLVPRAASAPNHCELVRTRGQDSIWHKPALTAATIHESLGSPQATCTPYLLGVNSELPMAPLGFPNGLVVKNPPPMQEMWVSSLDWEDPLEEEMATRSSILAWRIPWTEEPGGLQSRGSQSGVPSDLVTKQQPS